MESNNKNHRETSIYSEIPPEGIIIPASSQAFIILKLDKYLELKNGVSFNSDDLMSDKFIDWLAQKMKEHKLNQISLGKIANVKQCYISRLLNRHPTLLPSKKIRARLSSAILEKEIG